MFQDISHASWISGVSIASRGKMEHGDKMEHRVFRKKCAMCGSAVMSAWFPSLVSLALHNKIKLIDGHILNTTQNAICQIRSFWCINSLTFRVDYFDEVNYRTTESCYIESFTSFAYFNAFLIEQKAIVQLT